MDTVRIGSASKCGIVVVGTVVHNIFGMDFGSVNQMQNHKWNYDDFRAPRDPSAQQPQQRDGRGTRQNEPRVPSLPNDDTVLRTPYYTYYYKPKDLSTLPYGKNTYY